MQAEKTPQRHSRTRNAFSRLKLRSKVIRKANRKRRKNTKVKHDSMQLLQQKYQLAYLLAHWKVSNIRGNLGKSMLCWNLMR